MNRERAKELLPIIEAYANGEDIQFMPNQYNPEDIGRPTWSDLPDSEALTITFPCPDYSYRIKPKEPREFWAVVPQDGFVGAMCKDKNGVEHHGDVIKVREVL